MKKIIELLNSMERCIPDKEGSVSFNIFCDKSGHFAFNLWGVEVATCSFGSIFETTKNVSDFVEEDRKEAENIVEKLNSIISVGTGLFDKKGRFKKALK